MDHDYTVTVTSTATTVIFIPFCTKSVAMNLVSPLVTAVTDRR